MPQTQMPTVVIHNVETGERNERPMTDAEYAVYLQDLEKDAVFNS
jgi:hypothetical protein